MPSDDYNEPRDAENDERDTAQADEEHTDTDQPEEGVTFASLGLPDEILAAITDMGFRVPTPIQAAAIPPL